MSSFTRFWVPTVLIAFAGAGVVDNKIFKYANEATGECMLGTALQNEIAAYQPIVNRIADEVAFGKYRCFTWDALARFVDKFGPRLSGSQTLEDAIDYMVDELKQAGLENVHTENATVTHWVRGAEEARLIKPFKKPLAMLGLGSSIGTPRGGITADVIAVRSFDEFNKLDNSTVQGKIVVFAPEYESYGKTVIYRARGASEAAKKGAVAALVRTIAPVSINSPHTGLQRYEEGVKKIPVACITIEDAEMMLRMYRRGDSVQVHLEMEARNYPPVVSRNTIAELQGTEKTNSSVVVVSGHLDSWDVGVGAMDDGGGAFISWKALEYLKSMNLRPKRTIRAILWTGEEQGYLGAKEYAQQHKQHEQQEFNFFMESDMGTFQPRGLDFSGNKDAECIFKEILKLMHPLNATAFETPQDGGPDITTWTDRGFPGASLMNANERYFWYHHSHGDTMLVEDSESLDAGAALFAAAAYVIADLSIDMPKDVLQNKK